MNPIVDDIHAANGVLYGVYTTDYGENPNPPETALDYYVNNKNHEHEPFDFRHGIYTTGEVLPFYKASGFRVGGGQLRV